MIIINAKTREAVSLEDIAANDIVYVTAQEIDGDDYAIVQVVKDNKVEGDFGKYKADSAVIGGKSYDLTVIGEDVYATFSIDSNDTIESYAKKFEDEDTLKDAYGEKVTALTDVVGRVIHFSTDAKATSGSVYGVVDRYYDKNEATGNYDRVKLYIATEDKLVTYSFEEVKDSKKAAVGEFVKFKLNKDGEIADGKYDAATVEYTVKGDFGKDTVTTVEGDVFTVDTKSSIFVNAPDSTNYPINQDADDCELVQWADIADDDAKAAQFVVFADDNKEIEAVLFFEGLDSVSDEEAAYIVDTFRQNGDEAATVDFFGGKVEDIVVDSKSEAAAEDEMVAVAKKQSDGELEIVAYIKAVGDKFEIVDNSEDFAIVSGKITAKDGDYITVGGKSYKLSTDTIVYDEDDKKSKSNLSKDKIVDLVIEDGKNVRVVKLIDEARVFVAADAAVGAVIDAIDALPAVANMTLADEADVVAARTAYNALSAAQKANVTNFAALTAAEAKIVELKGGEEAGEATGTVVLTTVGATKIAKITVTAAEGATQFRAEGGTSVKAVGASLNVVVGDATSVTIELLDAAGDVVGTITVDVTANGSFTEEIQ